MFQVRMFQVHFRTLFEGEKNSFADLNREISEAEAILSDQAEQIDDRRNFSLSRITLDWARVRFKGKNFKCLPFLKGDTLDIRWITCI